ncbi:hypothetical protein Tco_0776161 [Tanacetum coccineum]
MCNESWGRSSFARCLIKVNSEADIVDVVTIGIPSLSRDGFTKETIRVEYEWRPPKCFDMASMVVERRQRLVWSTGGDDGVATVVAWLRYGGDRVVVAR